ncbi:MAG TPA: M67 family metallopeptidase [Thermodesulfobacteriota bacterium]|nr:M67 family metallopeptidase [Thermodesulfobacteriota bacterium]
MVVTIKKATLDKIIEHSESGFPHEVCGALIGDGKSITEFKICTNLNTERAHDRYELDPESFNDADKWARDNGLEIMGIYHTHPDHPSRPSEFDRERAWPDWFYIILSIMSGKFDNFRTWVLEDFDSQFVEYKLEVVD